MKINDLGRIDEQGITDWLAGKAKQWYQSKQMSGEIEKVAAAADKAQADQFYRNLGNALKSAEESGQIYTGATAVPGKLSAKDFVKMYINRGLRNYKIPAELNFDQNLQAVLDKFGTEYRGGGKLPSSGQELWSAVQTVKSVADIGTKVQQQKKNKKATAAQQAAAPAVSVTAAQPAAQGAPVAAQPAAVAPKQTPNTASIAPQSATVDQFKKLYQNMDSAERQNIRNQLDIIDDQLRLASGTNESKITTKIFRAKI